MPQGLERSLSVREMELPPVFPDKRICPGFGIANGAKTLNLISFLYRWNANSENAQYFDTPLESRGLERLQSLMLYQSKHVCSAADFELKISFMVSKPRHVQSAEFER
jgi:hypothetical protein